MSLNVSATDNQKVAKIALSIDGQQVSISYGSSLIYSWSVPSPKGGKKQTSSSSTITARAEDAAGNPATASVTVTRP